MFHCQKCGRCCKNLAEVSWYADLDRGDGVCRYFNSAMNLCNIYEIRPLKCNVSQAYEKFYKQVMSWEEYERKNYEACKILRDEEEKEGDASGDDI